MISDETLDPAADMAEIRRMLDEIGVPFAGLSTLVRVAFLVEMYLSKDIAHERLWNKYLVAKTELAQIKKAAKP